MVILCILPRHFSLQIYCNLLQARIFFDPKRTMLMLVNAAYDLEIVLSV